MLRKLFIVGAGIAGTAAVYGALTAREAWRRWGVEPAEAADALPGDELVADAQASDTRGIDIAAPPDKVWPWLVQMGYGRAGWYSYDQLDMNHPSADRILPEYQALGVGDVLPTDPGGGFEVKVVEPAHALVAYVDRPMVEAQRGHKGAPVAEAASPAEAEAPVEPGIEAASANVRATGAYLDKAVSGDFAASWAFVLEPRGEGTRLIERFRVRMEPPASTSGQPARIGEFGRKLLGFGVFVMVRRQMLGIRDRVEGRPSQLKLAFVGR
jgi:hypothetical protein